jgi:D-sedoheptulose 7-phosphate isomerase
VSFAEQYIAESVEILNALDTDTIDNIADSLSDLIYSGGRLFIVGVGGSAATASHAVSDFRKATGIEASSPADNVAELTARTNDDGWETTFVEWLKVSRIEARDVLLVLSVGGGSGVVSLNIALAVDYADFVGATILGIVGRDGGYTATVADPGRCLIIPPYFDEHITPHTEGLASVILHLLVSHPALAR